MNMIGGYCRQVHLCLVSLLLQLLLATYAQGQDSPLQSYIVYRGSNSPTVSSNHLDRLTTVVGSQILARESLIYSYRNFDAFAASLTPEQASILADQEDVVSVFPNRARELHTTRSWEFLGLEDSSGGLTYNSLWNKSDYGKDVIIGVVDTGVWPESESFNDEGFEPIPAKWKGVCQIGDRFGPSYCNRKLVGGQYFLNGFEAENGPLNSTENFRSARDRYGHGTHTSSTAGGSFARNASFLGLAPGTAKGGAPLARVAVYKVCWIGNGGCYDADIIAAFDQGISDGVEVFSVSLGSPPPLQEFFQDGLAIGSFHANRFNISVVMSAGNEGPAEGSVSNVAPWVTTVAAATIDRDFPSRAILGNGVSINGASLARESLTDNYALVSGADVYAAGANSTSSATCEEGSLDPAQVSGKIVVCLASDNIGALANGLVVKDAGGIGMIFVTSVSYRRELYYYAYNLPATSVTDDDGLKIFSYINSTQAPVARILQGETTLGVTPAPVLAYFSSQGPNTLIPDLLKPDITAPGFIILAAWTQARTVTSLPDDNRVVSYYLDSGTSMACPHVAGVIACLRALHPTWSPAALHSAVVTSASFIRPGSILDYSLSATTPFGVGGGQIDPQRAADPGLVYDNPPSAYFQFLCSLGYNETSIIAITGGSYACPDNPALVSDFNYPSITVSNLIDEAVVTRTVTNVGTATSTYRISVIDAPRGVQMTVSPEVLKFSTLGETQNFSVTLTRLSSAEAGFYAFGRLTWGEDSNTEYRVNSPIVVGIV